MHTKKELDQRLILAGVRPLKSLGQNFLVNPRIGTEIVKAVEKFSPKFVLEIGPGLGALTDELIQSASENSYKFSLVEIDSGLVEYWKKRDFPGEIFHTDALKIDWTVMSPQSPSVLVSNLPYSIAASLVVELSSSPRPFFDALVFMFQKEVAQRITARPGDEDYGMLSVVAQVAWKIDRLVDAGPQDFSPVPNVGSRVLVFGNRTAMNAFSSEFLSFVKLAFSQRRKKLLSNLSARYEKASISKALLDIGFEDGIRAQELSPEQFTQLFTSLERGTSHKKR